MQTAVTNSGQSKVCNLKEQKLPTNKKKYGQKHTLLISMHIGSDKYFISVKVVKNERSVRF